MISIGRPRQWERSVSVIDPNEPPTKLFEIDDWKIEIVLFGGFKENEVPSHAIATVMGEGRVVEAEPKAESRSAFAFGSPPTSSSLQSATTIT